MMWCTVLVDLDYQTAMAEGQWARPCGAPLVCQGCGRSDNKVWCDVHWMGTRCVAGHRDSYEVGETA